jgi:hypothetical protein
MCESLNAAKDEIGRLREVEEGCKQGMQLQQQLQQQNTDLMLNQAKIDADLRREKSLNESLSQELKESRDRERMARDQALAESSACALLKSREEHAASELVSARQQVCWLGFSDKANSFCCCCCR